MEIIVTNNKRGWDNRDGIEFNCSLCDFGAAITFYNDKAVETLRLIMEEHMINSHSQEDLVNSVILKSLFERIGVYNNKAVEVEKNDTVLQTDL